MSVKNNSPPFVPPTVLIAGYISFYLISQQHPKLVLLLFQLSRLVESCPKTPFPFQLRNNLNTTPIAFIPIAKLT